MLLNTTAVKIMLTSNFQLVFTYLPKHTTNVFIFHKLLKYRPNASSQEKTSRQKQNFLAFRARFFNFFLRRFFELFYEIFLGLIILIWRRLLFTLRPKLSKIYFTYTLRYNDFRNCQILRVDGRISKRKSLD